MTHKWFVDGMEVTTKLEEALVNGFIDLKRRIEALERAHEDASRIADRAHGPLEPQGER